MTDERDAGDEAEEQPTMNPRLNARMAALNAVGKSNEDERIRDGMDPPGDEEEEVTDNADPEGTHSQAEEDDGEDESQETVDRAPRTFKVKVNGKEIEMTEDEVIRRAQESESADQKFRDAARMRQETEQLLKAQAPPAKADEPAAVEEDDRAQARALQMGTEEEAARAIAKLRRPSVNTDDAARLVDERLSFRNAAEAAQKEFPKLFADPDLAQEFAVMDQNLMKAGDHRPYLERYREIGQFLSFRHGLAQTKETTLSEKHKRKASITPIRAAASRPEAEGEREDDYESVAAENLRQVSAARRGQHR